MPLKYLATIFCLWLLHQSSFSQKKDSLHVSFMGDIYTSWFPDATKSARPDWTVNYKKTNGAGLNFLAGSFHYRNNHFRTTIAGMAGEYPGQNLAAEEPWARNILEANVGYRFTSDEEVWLDMGILPSHIGTESPAGFVNPVATRNIISEISPYYETGIRLSYQPSPEWYFAILSLNGWQRITEPVSRLSENWGLQISWKPTPEWIMNSSSFIGKVPSIQGVDVTRIYSNIYTTLSLNPRSSFLAGWDWGIQENRRRQWHELLFQYRYNILKNKFWVNSRYEFISDPTGVFIMPADKAKPSLHMSSVNLDYMPNRFFQLRTELNYLFSNTSIVKANGTPVDRQLSVFLIGSFKFDYKK